MEFHDERRIKMRQLIDWFTAQYIRMFTCLKSEKGQTMVEYALILVLIAIVVILMVKGIGQNANNTFSSVNSALKGP